MAYSMLHYFYSGCNFGWARDVPFKGSARLQKPLPLLLGTVTGHVTIWWYWFETMDSGGILWAEVGKTLLPLFIVIDVWYVLYVMPLYVVISRYVIHQEVMIHQPQTLPLWVRYQQQPPQAPPPPSMPGPGGALADLGTWGLGWWGWWWALTFACGHGSGTQIHIMKAWTEDCSWSQLVLLPTTLGASPVYHHCKVTPVMSLPVQASWWLWWCGVCAVGHDWWWRNVGHRFSFFDGDGYESYQGWVCKKCCTIALFGGAMVQWVLASSFWHCTLLARWGSSSDKKKSMLDKNLGLFSLHFCQLQGSNDLFPARNSVFPW